MLLTLKNKTLAMLDALIEQAEKDGCIPDKVYFEPKEAADLLREIKNLEITSFYVKHKNGTESPVLFLLKDELTNDKLREIIIEWYKLNYKFYYRNIELKIFKKEKSEEKPDVLEPKTQYYENTYESKVCNLCGKKVHRKFWFFTDGCTNPKCDNYYKKLKKIKK